MPEVVTLRPLELADIDDEYCAWYQNQDGHLDFFSGSGRQFTRESLVADYERGLGSGGWYYFLAEAGPAGKKIGNVKLGPIDKKNKTADLVCLIGNRAYLGKGLAPKMIALANQIAFERFDIRRLHSGIYATNEASIRAYTRGGWKIEAVLKGYYLFNGQPVDRVCVRCLNPKYFPGADQ